MRAEKRRLRKQGEADRLVEGLAATETHPARSAQRKAKKTPKKELTSKTQEAGITKTQKRNKRRHRKYHTDKATSGLSKLTI